MFEDLDNKKKQETVQAEKVDKTESRKDFKPGNVPSRENLDLNKRFDLSQASTLPSPVNEKESKEFEKRMQGLHDKGKRRGLKFSIIGLFLGVIITVGTIYLVNAFKGDVQDISNEVERQNDEPIEAVIDTDNICNNDYCCLASLRRIKNNNYIKIEENENCPNDYTENALRCINSLLWCEPPAIIPNTASYTVEHAIIEENIDSDNDGLSDVLEIEYGTDINNPDTDGDGFLDGDEVENGYNPLE